MSNVAIHTSGFDLDSQLSDLKRVEDYRHILDAFQLEYQYTGLYLQVGDPDPSKGWRLHISIVRSQIAEALTILIPVLLQDNTPFSITRDKETARNMLDGNLGKFEVGKVIIVYAADPVRLAGILIRHTIAFNGPAVQADIHLGGQVYAPGGPDWPFGEFASQMISEPSKVLKGIYRPVKNLKSDPRGDVIKALYLRSLFHVKWCVIKQGVRHMWSDEEGRDMPDRLQWQYDTHRQLEGRMPLPKILDFFTEEDNTYLVMEYIKGRSIHDALSVMNPQCQPWKYWTLASRQQSLKFLTGMIELIDRLHQEGYVHRDVTPVNFMVDKQGRLVLIDIELAYSCKMRAPEPAFIMGTYGFMSPQQAAMETPTTHDDIYGLGATMLNLFTNLSPLTFGEMDLAQMADNLLWFIGRRDIPELIAACMAPDPVQRPNLHEIKATVSRLTELPTLLESRSLTGETIADLIQGAINGLAQYPNLIENGLWLSKEPAKDLDSGKQDKVFGVSGDFYDGLAGILYVVAKASKNGFDISWVQEAFNNSWQFINEKYFKSLPDIQPGVDSGAAGIAMALVEGIDAGLIENSDHTIEFVYRLLQVPNTRLDFASGIAGQGYTTIACRKYLDEAVMRQLLDDYVNRLLQQQRSEGYWIRFKDKKGKHKDAISFLYGNSGICLFMLEYLLINPDKHVRQSVITALAFLKRSVSPIKSYLRQHGCRQMLAGKTEHLDGIQGIIEVFIKAYEVLGLTLYKYEAESVLELLPANLVHDNFYYQNGLASFGRLYIQSHRMFQLATWKDRAGQIADVYAHTYCVNEAGSYYWRAGNGVNVVAGYHSGSAGIIDYLIDLLSIQPKT